jgi:hypothetical protein
MKHIRRIDADSFYYTFITYQPGKDIEEIFTNDLFNSELKRSDIYGKKLILSFLCEGHDHASSGVAVEWFIKHCALEKILVLYNTINPVDLPYTHLDLPLHMIFHGDWLKNVINTKEVEQKFICMIRRPSMSRALFASKIYKLPSMCLSFASHNCYTLTPYQYLFDQTLPILIDGLIPHDLAHTHNGLIYYTKLFHVVVETSSQTDPESYHSLFLTEKTWKAIGFRQIPIIFAMPNHVATLRSLGFDVFDDIVNHSYDLELDESKRMQMIADEIQRLDKLYNLAECKNLRTQLWPRLQSNFDLLVKKGELALEANYSI